MSLGRFVKRLLGRCGIEAYSRKNLPWGLKLERDLQRIFADRPNPVLFDVGANVGQTTLRCLSALEHATIFAFEPVSATHAVFRQATAGCPGVKAFQLALGDRDGEADMVLLDESGWNRIADGHHGGETRPTERVRIRTVDSFCAEHRVAQINLLKTDCEGYDLRVLHGADRMLREGQIAAVLCEVNFRRDNMHGDFFAIHAYLQEKHGFYFLALYDCEGWGPNLSGGSFCNALWLRPPA